MEWNRSFRVPFGSRREGDDDEEDDHEFHTTKSILDHNFNPFPGKECALKGLKLVHGDEVHRPVTISVPQNMNTTSNIARGTAITTTSSGISNNNSSSSSNWSKLQAERMKRKMTNEQLDSLEKSFQEEIKLEPERKVRLAQELGLQPRQVAVWFQNRRARWKTKQLERHFNTLKQEFLLISRENQKLQEEVVKLKGKIEDLQALGNQGSICDIADYTEASKEESVESKSAAICGSNNLLQGPNSFNCHQNIGDCNYLFNVEEYGTLASPSPWPYWGSLPGY